MLNQLCVARHDTTQGRAGHDHIHLLLPGFVIFFVIFQEHFVREAEGLRYVALRHVESRTDLHRLAEDGIRNVRGPAHLLGFFWWFSLLGHAEIPSRSFPGRLS